MTGAFFRWRVTESLSEEVRAKLISEQEKRPTVQRASVAAWQQELVLVRPEGA